MRKLLLSLTIILPVLTSAQSLEERIDEYLSTMSVEEKVYQLTHNTFFTTGDNTRLGIPGLIMSDGPHGVRFGGATSFPVGLAMASTFNISLIEEVGEAMAEEFWAAGKHQLLGPCVDLCRDPRNGRSAETASEDPYLAGEIGAAYVKGIQKTPVIATVKHLNLVNKQNYRHNSHITISDRMLMEHYGENFRKTIQNGGPLSVMNAYNLINNKYCSGNEYLLKTILRERWGFPFYVVSDWGAVHNGKNAFHAGTDICMASDHFVNEIPKMLEKNEITEQQLDETVSRVLKTKLLNGMMDYYPRAKSGLIDSQKHREVCLKAGREAMILLKNQDDILPLKKENINKIAVVGPSVDIMQIDGFGSSWVDVIRSVSPLQGIIDIVGEDKVSFTKGCDINSKDKSGFKAAINNAKNADYVIYVGGLDNTQEGEGYGAGGDRKSGSVDLPGVQQELINTLAKENQNLIVVLNSGGICAINKCIHNIKGLLYGFYPGQEGGTAIADVIFGNYNPAGRLPVTMPKNDKQIQPQNDDFTDDFGCGYRWYDEKDIVPEFAFGFGLSYTTFKYTKLEVSDKRIPAGSPLTVTCRVTNTGSVAGDEVVQLYLSNHTTDLWMPEKELKGFKRIHLKAGESKEVNFVLSAEDLYYWNEVNSEYDILTGAYTIRVGGSSDDLPLTKDIMLLEGIRKADLEITKVMTMPRYPVEGEKVQFFALVKNKGNSPVQKEEEVHVKFELNGQEISMGENYYGIPVGGMIMVESKEQYWPAVTGNNYSVVATVNASKSIAEITDMNNSAKYSYSVIDENTYQISKNIAVDKPVVSSSYESDQYLASNIVDGNQGTRWSSAWSDPQVLTIDLEELYSINTINVFWEAAFADKYKIELSKDKKDWVKYAEITQGNGGKDEFTQKVTEGYRYVRFTGLRRTSGYGYSIYEIEVFGTKFSEDNLIKHIDYVQQNP